SVPVSYMIYGDTNLITLNTGLINSGDSASIIFTEENSFSPLVAGNYILKYFTTLSGDTNFSNDTTSLRLTVIDPSRDAGVNQVSAISPGPYHARDSITFNALIKNFGIANLHSVPVSYKIQGDTNLFSINTGLLNSGDSASIIFTEQNSFIPQSSGNYILKFFTALPGDRNFSNDTASLHLTIIEPVGTTIYISLIIEGLYNEFRQDMNLSDTVNAYLREVSSPYNIVDSASAVIDSSTFEGEFHFLSAPDTSYYIVIIHRNSIETWSEYGFSTITNPSTILNYNFTGLQSSAYGNNLIKVDSVTNKFAIYSGDIDRDGLIDGSDLSTLDNAILEFQSGYSTEDCNGDGIVDGSDALIVSNNATRFITKIIP
ncbi:MAG: dockerin type I domain-containing protein, partial [Ignavibacteria bacterium]